MSADDILFEPLGHSPFGQTGSVVAPNPSIVRYPGAVLAEVRAKSPRALYVDLATEIIDYAVADMPSLKDVRLPSSFRPRGAMDLSVIVGRFHDGNEEVWVSRPKHASPASHRFTGRFGYVKACKMPQNMGKLGVLTWYWIDTDDGQLPAIDLGLLVYHPANKWWRVFSNKMDATDYFNS